MATLSPWKNPYCERIIGKIRRECLDHMIILVLLSIACLLPSDEVFSRDNRLDQLVID